MKRTALALASAFIALGISAAGPRMSQQIDSIIANTLPAGTDIAVMVYDLTSNSTVYAYREDRLCRPASITKVITSYTAASVLGLDFNFETRVRITGEIGPDSTLNGNVYLVGGLDPALTENDLMALAAGLKAKGIRRVNGNVYADVSIMDTVSWGPGWCWDDEPSSFQPYITPLMVHGGYIGVSVKPTTKGSAPTVSIYPPNSFIKVENRAVTGNESLGPLQITRDWMNHGNTVIITGNSKNNMATDLSVFKSDDFTFSLFLEYLGKQGVTYSSTGWEQCPDSAVTIATATHALTEVMHEALKESENRNADAMLLQTGRKIQPKGVSFDVAAKYESDWLRRATANSTRPFNVVDGSGLSMYDYLPASLFIDVLKLVYAKPELYKQFYNCMPVNGIDGTLKGRMKGTGIEGRIHAKTGSITGACSLAGYARGSDGHDYAFCIMNEGCIKLAASRKVQDEICLAICR